VNVKVGIVGAGMVGSAAANALVLRGAASEVTGPATTAISKARAR
jgi:2-polyprenyl-6-methoxyphenol hydroxylase-like FAD-dependent oxidoreductase